MGGVTELSEPAGEGEAPGLAKERSLYTPSAYKAEGERYAT